MIVSSVQAPPANASPQEVKQFHETREAARAFEAIFVRKMLASLEKATSSGKAGGGAPGGGLYGSMMVSSLADSVTQSGGIGLSDMIMRALQGPAPPPQPHTQVSGTVEEAGDVVKGGSKK